MKKLRKQTITACILMASMLALNTSATAAVPSVEVKVNGTKIKQEAVIKDNTTYVPLRAIADAIGGTTNYDKKTKIITIKTSDHTVIMTLNSQKAKVDGEDIVLTTPPMSKNGLTMVPLKFVSKAFGCNVDYDKKSKTVFVVTESGKASNITKVPTVPSGGSSSTVAGKKDAYGNSIRTTNLPKNASLFPYIQSDIPNWAYEQQPWNDNIWGFKTTDNGYPQYRKVASFPKDTLEEYSDFWANNYEHLDKFIDALMNVDYRTINDQEWLDIMMNEFNPNSYTKNQTDMRAYLAKWTKAFKESQYVTKCEYRIMPETLWVDNMSRSVGFNFSVYMKWTLVSNTNKWYNVPGEAGAWNAKDLSTSYNGKTLEGIVTFHVDRKDNSGKYYIHYSLCSPESQLNPKCNLYNGLAPNQKLSSQDNSFIYAWAGKDSKPVGRYDDVDAPASYAY